MMQRRDLWVVVLLVLVVVPTTFAQRETGASAAAATTPVAAPAPDFAWRYQIEASAFDNIVSNGFGHWGGGGLTFHWQGTKSVFASGSILSQRRPGSTQQLATARTVVNWSKWLYTDTSISGGGPDEAAAFFPRFRYDLAANVKLPWVPGLVASGGLTRIYFGDPVSGSIARAGVIYYWRKFVMQANLNFNTAQPGDQRSKSANAAVQYGQEGRYWVGFGGGGGREAWQTLTLTPQDVQFTSYSTSVFFRKWLAPQYGLAFSYDYVLKRTAYRINGLGLKFFYDF